MSVKITAVDLETGASSEAVGGTTVLTLKGRNADLMGTVDLGPVIDDYPGRTADAFETPAEIAAHERRLDR